MRISVRPHRWFGSKSYREDGSARSGTPGRISAGCRADSLAPKASWDGMKWGAIRAREARALRPEDGHPERVGALPRLPPDASRGTRSGRAASWRRCDGGSHATRRSNRRLDAVCGRAGSTRQADRIARARDLPAGEPVVQRERAVDVPRGRSHEGLPEERNRDSLAPAWQPARARAREVPRGDVERGGGRQGVPQDVPRAHRAEETGEPTLPGPGRLGDGADMGERGPRAVSSLDPSLGQESDRRIGRGWR